MAIEFEHSLLSLPIDLSLQYIISFDTLLQEFDKKEETTELMHWCGEFELKNGDQGDYFQKDQYVFTFTYNTEEHPTPSDFSAALSLSHRSHFFKHSLRDFQDEFHYFAEWVKDRESNLNTL